MSIDEKLARLHLAAADLAGLKHSAVNLGADAEQLLVRVNGGIQATNMTMNLINSTTGKQTRAVELANAGAGHLEDVAGRLKAIIDALTKATSAYDASGDKLADWINRLQAGR